MGLTLPNSVECLMQCVLSFCNKVMTQLCKKKNGPISNMRKL